MKLSSSAPTIVSLPPTQTHEEWATNRSPTQRSRSANHSINTWHDFTLSSKPMLCRLDQHAHNPATTRADAESRDEDARGEFDAECNDGESTFHDECDKDATCKAEYLLRCVRKGRRRGTARKTYPSVISWIYTEASVCSSAARSIRVTLGKQVVHQLCSTHPGERVQEAQESRPERNK